MLTELKYFFSQFNFLLATDIAVLMATASVSRIKKGELLIKAGELHYHLHVVLKGLFRTYVSREDGEERTVYLASRGMPMGSSKTVFANRPGNENVVALEDSIVLGIDHRSFKQICEGNPALFKMYMKMMEKSMLEAIERIEYHVVLNSD